MPVPYEPSVFFVVNGHNSAYIGACRANYTANEYLIFSTPSPVEFSTKAGEDGSPALALSIRVDVDQLAELAFQSSIQEHDTWVDPISVTPGVSQSVPISEALLRLIGCLSSKAKAEILGPTLVREILYRVLSEPDAVGMRALLKRDQHLPKIHAALDLIHREYVAPISIPCIARKVGMSLSAFHHCFKEITGRSPLQYVKTVRLLKARLRLRYDGLSASDVAASVGYRNPSQLSRDFKQHFGRTVSEDRKSAGSISPFDRSMEPRKLS